MKSSAWSRGMILLSGSSGPEFESRSGPFCSAHIVLQNFEFQSTTLSSLVYTSCGISYSQHNFSDRVSCYTENHQIIYTTLSYHTLCIVYTYYYMIHYPIWHSAQRCESYTLMNVWLAWVYTNHTHVYPCEHVDSSIVHSCLK